MFVLHLPLTFQNIIIELYNEQEIRSDYKLTEVFDSPKITTFSMKCLCLFQMILIVDQWSVQLELKSPVHTSYYFSTWWFDSLIIINHWPLTRILLGWKMLRFKKQTININSFTDLLFASPWLRCWWRPGWSSSPPTPSTPSGPSGWQGWWPAAPSPCRPRWRLSPPSPVKQKLSWN